MLETALIIFYLAGFVPAIFLMRDIGRRDLPLTIKQWHTLAGFTLPFLYPFFYFRVALRNGRVADLLLLTATRESPTDHPQLEQQDED